MQRTHVNVFWVSYTYFCQCCKYFLCVNFISYDFDQSVNMIQIGIANEINSIHQFCVTNLLMCCLEFFIVSIFRFVFSFLLAFSFYLLLLLPLLMLNCDKNKINAPETTSFNAQLMRAREFFIFQFILWLLPDTHERRYRLYFRSSIFPRLNRLPHPQRYDICTHRKKDLKKIFHLFIVLFRSIQKKHTRNH